MIFPAVEGIGEQMLQPIDATIKRLIDRSGVVRDHEGGVSSKSGLQHAALIVRTRLRGAVFVPKVHLNTGDVGGESAQRGAKCVFDVLA